MKGNVATKKVYKAKWTEEEARKLLVELTQIRTAALERLPGGAVYRSVDELITFLDERGPLR